MGYSVKWSGTDLVRTLHNDSTYILGRPFAMYVVALATEVDRDALDWLRQYGRAIDSLTGADVAFLTFCNSTVNHVVNINKTAESVFGSLLGLGGPDGAHFVDAQSTRHFFRDDRPAFIKIDDGDTAARDMELATARRDEAFVRSMTYESDNFARALGLDLAELPCLVFFDDPGSGHYYVMSMYQEPGELIQRLRKIVGSYYRDAQGNEFIECMHLLRQIMDRIAAAPTERTEIERRRAACVITFAPEPRLEPDGHCIDKLVAMQGRLAELGGQCPESPGWANLVHAFNEVWEVRADLSMPPKLQRFIDFAATIRASIENENLSLQDARQLRKLYNKVRKYLRSGSAYPATGQDWLNVLELSASSEFAERCDKARNCVARLQSALPAALMDITAYFDHQLDAVEERRQEAEREQAQLSERLQGLERPSLEPTIRELRWAARRERTKQFASAAAGTITRDPTFLLKVLALFRIGTGG